MEITQVTGQVVLVIFFVVPGLIYLWTFERLVGRLLLTGIERLLRAVAMSTVVYAISSPWLVRLADQAARGSMASGELAAAGIVLLLVLPFGLGLLVATLSRSSWWQEAVRRANPQHPMPAAWDFAMGKQRPFFVRARLKDGSFVGGVFGDGSYASSHPQEPSLFLEEQWALKADGSFEAPAAGTAGIYIGSGVMEVVELSEVDVEEALVSEKEETPRDDEQSGPS